MLYMHGGSAVLGIRQNGGGAGGLTDRVGVYTTGDRPCHSGRLEFPGSCGCGPWLWPGQRAVGPQPITISHDKSHLPSTDIHNPIHRNHNIHKGRVNFRAPAAPRVSRRQKAQHSQKNIRNIHKHIHNKSQANHKRITTFKKKSQGSHNNHNSSQITDSRRRRKTTRMAGARKFRTPL